MITIIYNKKYKII